MFPAIISNSYFIDMGVLIRGVIVGCFLNNRGSRAAVKAHVVIRTDK